MRYPVTSAAHVLSVKRAPACVLLLPARKTFALVLCFTWIFVGGKIRSQTIPFNGPTVKNSGGGTANKKNKNLFRTMFFFFGLVYLQFFTRPNFFSVNRTYYRRRLEFALNRFFRLHLKTNKIATLLTKGSDLNVTVVDILKLT